MQHNSCLLAELLAFCMCSFSECFNNICVCFKFPKILVCGQRHPNLYDDSGATTEDGICGTLK